MNFFVMLAGILFTSLLTGLVLCYTVFVLLKRVRTLEQLLTESKSIIQGMSDLQKSNLENQAGKNQLLLVLSNKLENKGETMTADEAQEGDKTIH